MHKVYTIKKIVKESPNTNSYIFEGKIDYSPGQFIMLWLPGIDEKPFAVSCLGHDEFGVTVEEKGLFTKELAKVKEGSKVGIRGPYGNGFKPKDSSIIVAGGLGMAPAVPLIQKVKNSVIIQGARSKDFLLYHDSPQIKKACEKNNNRIIYCTDDGSFGIKGFVTEVLKNLISEKTKAVFCCGPEMMMTKVFELCEKEGVECQASLERMMKCAIGICGSCVINDRLVCKDGPVFDSEQLRKLNELGKFAHAKSGKKVSLIEYYKK